MYVPNEIFRKLRKKTLQPQRQTFMVNVEGGKPLKVNVLAPLFASIPPESELSHFHQELIYIHIKKKKKNPAFIYPS